jgi:hypothetical protein
LPGRHVKRFAGLNGEEAANGAAQSHKKTGERRKEEVKENDGK